MNNIDQMSIGQLEHFAHAIPGAQAFLDSIYCNSYDDFVKRLYTALDRAISTLEDARHLVQDDCEDRLNVDLVGKLVCAGYSATHDTQTGGHCDLHVEYKDYRWTGEAKIYKGNAYLNEGFLQLSSRYTTGNTNQNQGALIIYIKNENAQQIMSSWKTDFQSKHEEQVIELRDDVNKATCFFSTHTHQSSGTNFTTRHIPVLLHFDPKDRSARNSKKST